MIIVPKNFDVQGHRGCRGLLPENTLQAFEKALELGVTTLEMDLVISKDHKVVVSHEPYFSHEISTSPNGGRIKLEDELNHNIFLMPYEEIIKYDVGKVIHPRFPKQKQLTTFKPLFEKVVEMAEDYCLRNNTTIGYNIEIKSSQHWEHVYHPEVSLYADLIVDILITTGISSRTMIQSFDVRALQYLNKKYPWITTSFLIENELTMETNLERLGFLPKIYSPEYIIVTKELVEKAHQKSMKVIPWTVNTTEEIKALIQLGVDGIITDYPDLFCIEQEEKTC